jgi:hypothetical protein
VICKNRAVNLNWLSMETVSWGDVTYGPIWRSFFSPYVMMVLKFSVFTTTKFMLYAFFWVIHRHLYFKCRCFGTHCPIFIGRWVYLPVYEDGTEWSEMAFKLQMLVNHPEESILHSEHSESLKSRTKFMFIFTCSKCFHGYKRSWFTSV